VNGALAIDIGRATRLQQQGYHTWAQAIPAEITPKNRLLLGEPVDQSVHSVRLQPDRPGL
jgi:hypothetical protein